MTTTEDLYIMLAELYIAQRQRQDVVDKMTEEIHALKVVIANLNEQLEAQTDETVEAGENVA